MDGGAKAGRGGSALKRLKSDLKSAGVLGPQAKKRRTEPAELRGKPQRGENPFELKFTRAKHDVLGKSRAAVAGRPGATKIKAEERVGNNNVLHS